MTLTNWSSKAWWTTHCATTFRPRPTHVPSKLSGSPDDRPQGDPMSIASDHASLAAGILPRPALLIGADRVEKTTAGTFDHINPTTGEVLGQIPIAGQEEVDR